MSKFDDTPIQKKNIWCGIAYPENMIDDWEDRISEIMQLPLCYVKHYKDFCQSGEHRKDHVHIMFYFPNVTTKKHAKTIINMLSKEGKVCCPVIQAVISPGKMYDYMIHADEESIKKGKHRYGENERICLNCFDIGAVEQIGVVEKRQKVKELCDIIKDCHICNFVDFYDFVMTEKEDLIYFECIQSYSGLFERLTRGNYLKYMKKKDRNEDVM